MFSVIWVIEKPSIVSPCDISFPFNTALGDSAEYIMPVRTGSEGDFEFFDNFLIGRIEKLLVFPIIFLGVFFSSVGIEFLWVKMKKSIIAALTIVSRKKKVNLCSLLETGFVSLREAKDLLLSSESVLTVKSLSGIF